MKKTKQTFHTLYIPTLLDKSGVRHIVPATGSAAYCGAMGSQHFPHDYKASELCQRCVQAYATEMAKARMDAFFGGKQ